MPHCGDGVGEAGGIVPLGLGDVRLGAHLVLGVLEAEIRAAAVGCRCGFLMLHAQDEAGDEVEAQLVGALADQLQGVVASGNELLQVERGAVPDDVVGPVDIVAPALAGPGVVEQDAAISHRVGNGVDPQIHEFVYGRGIQAPVHGGLVNIDRGVPAIGVEDDLVFVAHVGSFLVGSVSGVLPRARDQPPT